MGHRHCACKQGTCSAVVELFTGDAINRVFFEAPKVGNIGIFVLLKYENELEPVPSNINFNLVSC